jgi:O-antigen/teichoic acid export membrane protein
VVTASDSGVREGLSSVTRGTLWLLVATLCLVGLTFVSRVMLIRSISPEAWNAFWFGVTLAGVLSAFGTLGLPSAIARNIPYATNDDERRGYVRSSLIVGCGAALGFSVALWVFGPAIGHALGQSDIGLGLEYFPIAVGASIVGTVIASIFQGYEDVTPNALFLQIVNPALFVAFLGFAIVAPPFGISYTEALLAYVAANAVTLGLLVFYLLYRLPRVLPPGPRSPDAFGSLMRFAAPLFVVGIMASVTGSGDTLILGVYHSGEVGVYGASLTLSRLLQIGIGALGYIFLPVASKFLRQNDTRSIVLTYTTVTKWMILISLPLFLLFFFLPAASLGFVYGPSYTLVLAPLQISVLGAFVTTLLGPSTTAQVAYGQTRLLMYNAVAAGVTDLLVSFWLVPSFGYAGAAVAWGSANALYAALSLAELALLSGVHPFRRHFIVPLLATALPVGALLALLRPSVPLLVLPALGLGIAVLFVVLVLVTRSVDEGDRLLLEAVERILGRPLPFLRRLGRHGLPDRS